MPYQIVKITILGELRPEVNTKAAVEELIEQLTEDLDAMLREQGFFADRINFHGEHVKEGSE